MHGLTDGNLFPGFPPSCPLLMVLYHMWRKAGWQLANQTKIKMQDSARGVWVSVWMSVCVPRPSLPAPLCRLADSPQSQTVLPASPQ